MADFPHVGDIMVLSTVYPDGTVAAMEELIGSHGGMGGVQTDAFLFHPADMHVPSTTTNSTDVFLGIFFVQLFCACSADC